MSGAATVAALRAVVVNNAAPEVALPGRDESAGRAIARAKVIASGEMARFIASRGAEGPAILMAAAPAHLSYNPLAGNKNLISFVILSIYRVAFPSTQNDDLYCQRFQTAKTMVPFHIVFFARQGISPIPL